MLSVAPTFWQPSNVEPTAFQRRYGEPLNDGSGGYVIPSDWQTGITNAVQVGSIIGLQINGYAIDRWGYTKTFRVATVFMIAFIFIPFFAVNLGMLLAGELLCGLPWGG